VKGDLERERQGEGAMGRRGDGARDCPEIGLQKK